MLLSESHPCFQSFTTYQLSYGIVIFCFHVGTGLETENLILSSCFEKFCLLTGWSNCLLKLTQLYPLPHRPFSYSFIYFYLPGRELIHLVSMAKGKKVRDSRFPDPPDSYLLAKIRSVGFIPVFVQGSTRCHYFFHKALCLHWRPWG